jgi:hypothetical protein
MPVVQLRRTANVRQMPTAQIYQQLEAVLPTGRTNGPWSRVELSQQRQQYLFSRAIELHHRQNVTTSQKNRALAILRHLAMNYNRVWTNNPRRTQLFAGSNNNESNSNEFMPYYRAAGIIGSPQAARAPNANYSKASAAAKKWLAMRPHTIHQNVVNIKLPANATDPVSYTNFKIGNEAVMVIKKRLLSNGAMRSRRTFYNKNTIERLARGKQWNTILRMKGADAVFKDPINRRTVYRRDLMNVKFV